MTTTKVEHRQTGASVEELIAQLEQATHPREIELLADYLGDERDPRAIRPLVMHLGDVQVRADADVEEAVCRALMALGVMSTARDHSFRLRPRPALADDVVATIREFAGTIPWQYFGTRSV